VPDDAHTTASDEQIDGMLAHAKGNRRALVLLTMLVDPGARKREIAAVADLHLTSGTVRFPVSKTVARTVP